MNGGLGALTEGWAELPSVSTRDGHTAVLCPVHAEREPADGGWRRLERRLLHQGPVIGLEQDTVRRPDGSIGQYEHVTVEDAVRVVALDTSGRVVLVEDAFYLQSRRMLHLPGGGVHQGEAPVDAASRELLEETGLQAAQVELFGV